MRLRFFSAPPAPERKPADGEDRALEILRDVRRIEIQSKRLVHDLFSGQYHAAFKGRGIEFADVREYVPGDDVRSIDWNVTARMDRPFVKQFHEERERTVVFLVDRSASMKIGSRGPDGVTAAARVTALLAFSAAANQDKVGLLLFSATPERWVPPRKGRSHLLRVVRDILVHEPAGRGTSIREALEHATRILRRRSLVFLVSDFFQDESYGPALAIAARKHEVIPIVLIDPLSAGLAPVGLIDLEDPETSERRILDASDAATRRGLQDLLQARRDRRLSIFRDAGVSGIEVPVDRDPSDPLIAYFRRREKWRAAGR